MSKIMFPEARGVLNDINEKLAGSNSSETLEGLKKFLRGENPFSNNEVLDAGAELFAKKGLEVKFGWMFDWAKPVNEKLKPLSGQDQLDFLRRFIQDWMSFRRGPSAIHIFPGISQDRQKAFLEMIDDATQPYLGMRLMYTWARGKRDGKSIDQFRCWYGIPLDFCDGHTESDRKGLVFTLTGSNPVIGYCVEQLLSDEERESGFDIQTDGPRSTTVYGLIVNRERPTRSPGWS